VRGEGVGCSWLVLAEEGTLRVQGLSMRRLPDGARTGGAEGAAAAAKGVPGWGRGHAGPGSRGLGPGSRGSRR
jgi:hypothetical protein